ncbi:MAG: WYL domain-containing protein [Myxococcota bacterium]
MTAHERREALLGWLRGRRSATAAEVAARFGVSERTVYRDVAALRDRGEPLSADAGPGGGLRLDPEALLPPVRLAADEVVGLVLSLRLARQAAPTAPFSRAADAAVDRLVGALPPARASELRRWLGRIVVGRPASAHTAATVKPIPPTLLAMVERGFTARRALRFGYTDRADVRSSRRCEPHGLLVQVPAWYVLGVDLDREAPRMFRMDRIDRATVLDVVPFVPRPVEVLAALVVPEAR